MLVKLTLRDLSRSGDIVGKIYAVSTAGSIVGTFLTGFWLVSMFGTRAIILGVSLLLFLLALLFGDSASARALRPLGVVCGIARGRHRVGRLR